MQHPRLTIGIPTYNRPERLSAAITSALGQSVPARVLVCDQTGKAEGVVKAYLGNPLVRYVKSPATCLWENWCHAAECCETELFAWMQDDDSISPHFTHRIVGAFDSHPRCPVYIGRLGISLVGGLGNWWQGTGPMVPMDLLHGTCTEICSGLVQASAYFTSLGLSPAVAFRVNPDTIAAVRRCPVDCDLFNERLVLAELCRLGPAVCGPAVLGYWVQHEGNESRVQVKAGDAERQYRAMVKQIDGILGDRTDWIEPVGGWALMAGAESVKHWLTVSEIAAEESASLAKARDVLLGVVRMVNGVPDDIPEHVREQRPETAIAAKPAQAERAVRRGGNRRRVSA